MNTIKNIQSMTRFIQSGILPLQSYIHGNFFKKVILLFRTVSETFCQLFSESLLSDPYYLMFYYSQHMAVKFTS